MFVQIYAMQSAEEALACIEAGADRIGVLTEEPGGPYPCGVTREECRRIFAAVGEKAVKILISTRKTEEEILEETADLLPDVLHLCAEYRGTPEFRKKLRERVPSVQLMEAIGVTDASAVEDAIKRSEYADLLILDTIAEDVPGIGAAGKAHDWSIDAEIVKAVNIPVVLAGGLGPANVLEAIETVHPAGVDSLTKTSIRENGKLVRKDIDAVRAFAALAHSVKE